MRTLLLSASITVLVTLTANAQTATPLTATCRDGTTWTGRRDAGRARGITGSRHSGLLPAALPLLRHHGSCRRSCPATGLRGTRPSPAPSSVAAPPIGQLRRGSAGQVWVNTRSKVYHCPGDRYYGHTVQGTYMTEAAATAAGDRPSRGKACS